MNVVKTRSWIFLTLNANFLLNAILFPTCGIELDYIIIFSKQSVGKIKGADIATNAKRRKQILSPVQIAKGSVTAPAALQSGKEKCFNSVVT